MRTEKAAEMGQLSAAHGLPRTAPDHLADESRRAWFKGYDNEMAGQRLDRGIREEPYLD